MKYRFGIGTFFPQRFQLSDFSARIFESPFEHIVSSPVPLCLSPAGTD